MYRIYLKLLLLATTGALLDVHAQVWTNPYFEATDSADIQLQYLSNGSPLIEMLEEIATPYQLVIINYEGSVQPRIESFTTGSAEHLQLSVTRFGSKWAINVLNRQDYDANDLQQRYEFNVAIGTQSVSLLINTLNIIDNWPSLTYDGPCRAYELEANHDTECRFKVHHPDGITIESFNGVVTENIFRLVITGENQVETLFYLREDTAVPQRYSREYTLIVRYQLFFKERAMYSFKTTVFDAVDHNASIDYTLLQVIDVPNEPPMWTVPFGSKQFDEKQAQTFYVAAIDGDTDINKPIEFALAFAPSNQFYADLIAIDQKTGEINVQPINRDALKQEVFPFTIIAYKADNRSWAIEAYASVIVNDINDNIPVVTSNLQQIRMLENTTLTLPISLTVNDIDLGEHATYTVYLEDTNSEQTYSKPFLVIPDKGYQEASFTITVANTEHLDYEAPEWQRFQITVVGRETFDLTHISRHEFTIELINWNDEPPIFAQDEFQITINETTPKDINLITILAKDRDIDDSVVHSIRGPEGLRIDSATGVISTIMDNTFDYDRQNQVIIQVTATDTLVTEDAQRLHTAYAQLTINLLDVNNQTPELRMPRVAPRMFENEPGGYKVTEDGIIATDPDTTTDLRFEINWAASYATKSGQEAPTELYWNCFIIVADTTNPNRVIGHLHVNPDFAPLLVDYEEYEVIYLSISVTDHNQYINEGTTEAVLTIRIRDVNDNAPLFIENTLNTQRTVVEEALPNTLLGTVFANDIDGPEFNKISYTIRPEPGTPDDWVLIDSTSGEIRVAPAITVGCDIPKRDALFYTVSLTDGLHITEGIIRIDIIDINNQFPQIGSFPTSIELYENITTGEHIQRILASDADRDMPHNIPQYLINFANFPTLSSYFVIDPRTGVIDASLAPGLIFDRDRGLKSFDIHVDVRDNYLGNGNTNSNSTMVKLILLDVNDNAPELPDPTVFRPVLTENSEEGTSVGIIVAPDIDDERTPNAKVGFRILSIAAGQDTASPVPDNLKDLFKIDVKSEEAQSAELRLGKHGRGFYGNWLVEVEAFDHGHLWDSRIQLKSSQTYTVFLDPYNFNAPELIYPTTGKLHRLSFDKQQSGRPLQMADNTPIPLFVAKDDDGGIYGSVTFSMVDNIAGSRDVEFFDLVQVDSKSAQLYLRRPIEAKFYRINVVAEDGGGRRSDWAINVVLVFVDMTGEPVFDMPTFHTDFTENITGLEETRLLPAAQDPKNAGIDDPELQTEIFYFIDPNFEDAALFKLDPVTRFASLTQQLDRENIDHHRFRVIATNSRTFPQGAISANSYLVIEVSVNDVNDNPPAFEYSSYGSGITVNDAIGKVVLYVKATDPDLDDVIRYAVKPNTFQGVGENLDAVLTNPFEVNKDSGAVTLNFAVSAAMKGYIMFQVQAFDLVDHEDTTNVKIYIISESNRVTFVFLNDKDTVDIQRERIGEILTEFYGYECNIDDVTKSEINGVAQDTTTNMRAHFIQNNEAIESSLILSRSNDVVFITRLMSALLLESINLIDVPNRSGNENNVGADSTVQITLIVVSAILGIVLVAIIMFYTFRIRNLHRQLKAFSTTFYEPDEKSSKRPEAPTTNEFAKENSNPVLTKGGINSFDNQRMFDSLSLISESSDDAEFVGINNDPTFMQSGKTVKTGANTAVINGYGLHQELANHSNLFGTESSTDKKDSKASEDELYRF